MTSERKPSGEPDAAAPGDAAVDTAPPRGRIERVATWSRGHAQRLAAWLLQARERHASVDIGFRLRERDRQVAAMVLAGGIAYRIFFWLLALALVVGGVLGFFSPAAAEEAAADEGLGAGLAAAVSSAARSSQGNEWWLLLVGGWLLLWAGYTCTKALVLVHGAVWNVPPPSVSRPFRGSLIFTGGLLGFLAALAGARWLRQQSPGLGLAATLLVFALPFAFWLLATRALPNRASGWVDLAPGAALVAVGMQAMNLFTAYFLGPKLTSATQLYGVIGIATTALFWLYLTGRLIIGGATLNSSIAQHRSTGSAG